MLRWILFVALGVAALVAVVAVIGTLLPKAHRASRTVTYAATPAAVFGVVTDFARFPEWRSDVKSVEILDEAAGLTRFREHGRHGPVTYRVELREPDTRLITRIDDPSLPFGGTWTLEITPAPDGTLLTITEDGEIHNPIFRALSKVIFSPYATIDSYQADLRKRLEAHSGRS